MSYKADRRGKYPGCKVHFDEKDCQEFLEWHKKWKSGTTGENSHIEAVNFCRKIAKTIKTVMAEHPDVLKERTEEQVRESLLKDQSKIEEQLATMKSGADWKAVK